MKDEPKKKKSLPHSFKKLGRHLYGWERKKQSDYKYPDDGDCLEES